jgi:hypothetical protein
MHSVHSARCIWTRLSFLLFIYPVRIRDQDVNVARIQPNLYHQLSINKRLGLENQRQQSADFLNAEVRR